MDKVQFSKDAWSDFSHWLSEDRKTTKRILQLIEDIN